MLALFGIDVGDIVSEAIRKLVDLLVPDFAAGWATSLTTSLVAVPDVTGSGFAQLEGLREGLRGVGFALLTLCVVAGGLQVWLAGLAQGGMRAGELVRRAVVAAGAMAVLPMLLSTAIVGTNLATAQLIESDQVKHGLDSAFGEAFAFGAFTQGLGLGLAVPAAFAVAFFTLALLVMKAGLTAMLAVLVVGSPIVLGLSPLPQARSLLATWCGGLGAVLVIPVAWALVFSVAALLAGDALVLAGGPFESLAKPLAAVACFWLAYRAPGFLLAAGRAVGVHPGSVLSAVPARLGGRGGSGAGRAPRGGAGAQGGGGRFAGLVGRGPGAPSAQRPPSRPVATRAAATGTTTSVLATGRTPAAQAAAGPASPVPQAPGRGASQTSTSASPSVGAPRPHEASPVRRSAAPRIPASAGERRVGDLVIGPRPPRFSRPEGSPAEPRQPRPFPSTTGQRPASGRPTPAASRARSKVQAVRVLRPSYNDAKPAAPRPEPTPKRPAPRPTGRP